MVVTFLAALGSQCWVTAPAAAEQRRFLRSALPREGREGRVRVVVREVPQFAGHGPRTVLAGSREASAPLLLWSSLGTLS